MKTAITELIDTFETKLMRLIDQNRKYHASNSKKHFENEIIECETSIGCTKNTIEHLTVQLSKEREHLEDSYIDGANDEHSNGQGKFSTSANEYFTKTYEQ
jgi:hypothetical protein